MTKARTLADNFAADINGITAGTGITGGGTSGTVTITNQMATTIDAKGDLVVGTGADTFGRLAVASTAGYLLSVDSAEATGLKWIAPAAAGYVGVSVYKSANQSIDPSADVVVTWNTEDFDTDSFHSNTTNTGRFTIPSGKGGKYLLTGTLNWEAGAGTYREVKIYKNGSILTRMVMFAGTNDGCNQSFACVYDLVATDYLEIAARHSNGGSFNVLGGSGFSRAQLTYLGA